MAEPKVVDAERAELEQLRAEKAARDRADAGIERGILRCNTPGCEYGDKEVDLRKVVHKRIVEETGVVENAVEDWVYDGQTTCGQCGYALTVIPPNATTFFPDHYRYQFGEPR